MNRLVDYVDPDGRKFKRLIPAHAPDTDAIMGIEIGPPDLAALGLPLEIERRLNHQLFARGLFTAADVRRRPDSVIAALMAAYKADANKVMELYDA